MTAAPWPDAPSVSAHEPSHDLVEEHAELRQVLRQVLGSQTDPGRNSPDEWSRSTWVKLSRDIGLAGLGVPEELGGAGSRRGDLLVAIDELGRALYDGPFLGSVVLATQALLGCDDQPFRTHALRELSAGSVTAALLSSDIPIPESGGAAASARDDGTLALDGTFTVALDTRDADVLIVRAAHDGEPVLAGIRLPEPGVEVRALDGFDDRRNLSRVDLRGALAQLLLSGPSVESVMSGVRDLALLAIAAEQLGGARACFETGVSYAKNREQFGKPIASFQAIKHRWADLFTLLESATSVLEYAVWAVDHSPEELPVLANLAKAYCTDAFCEIAGATTQIHGGMGFTWEQRPHLYVKRAHSSAVLIRNSDACREDMLQLLGI